MPVKCRKVMLGVPILELGTDRIVRSEGDTEIWMTGDTVVVARGETEHVIAPGCWQYVERDRERVVASGKEKRR